MKRLMICMTIIAAMATLAGCEKASEVKVQSGDFNVERLFTVDGCTAYRFRDSGRAIYYTNCQGSTNSEEASGKSGKQQTVQTDRTNW